MPCRKVGGEEEAGESDGDRQPPARPVHRLAGGAGQQPEERQCERQTPEACSYGTGVGEAHQPGAERKRDIAGKQRRISKTVGSGVRARQRTCRR